MLDNNHYCAYRVIKSYINVQSAFIILTTWTEPEKRETRNPRDCRSNITDLGIERIYNRCSTEELLHRESRLHKDLVIRQN